MVSANLIRQAVHKAVFTVRQNSWQEMQHWNYINIHTSCPKLCMSVWLSIAVCEDVECKFKFWHLLLFSKWSISFKIGYFTSKVKIAGFTILWFKKIRNLLIPLTVPESILTLWLTLQMVLPLYNPSTDSARALNNTMRVSRLLQQWTRRKVFSQHFQQETAAKGPDILQKTLCFMQNIWKRPYFQLCKSASQTFWSYLSQQYLWIFPPPPWGVVGRRRVENSISF